MSDRKPEVLFPKLRVDALAAFLMEPHTIEEIQRYFGIKERHCRRLLAELRGRMAVHRIAIPGKRKSKYTVDDLTDSVVEGVVEEEIEEEEIDKNNVRKEYSKDKQYLEVTSYTVHTLEQALEVAEVDLEKWEVDRYTINSWTTTMKIRKVVGKVILDEPKTRTNYQVKVWLKARTIEVLDLAIRKLIQEMPKFVPPKKTQRKVPKTPYALEMCLYDAHIGKLAWGKETLQGDYDIDIATDLFVKSAIGNLNYTANFNFEKVFLILGQDFFHVENYQSQTPLGGIKLDVDSRLLKIYWKGKEAFLKTVYLCREVAPVEILWVPGNHDMHASFYLSEVVKEHFKNDEFVMVDNTAPWEKARLWGNLLVGYTHDANIRMANVVNMLPQFWPELWGQSKYREWHTGHKHTKAEWKFMPTQTVGGVIVRQIPTLSTIDAWHSQNKFVDAVPGGESFVWSKENGICAHFTAYVNLD